MALIEMIEPTIYGHGRGYSSNPWVEPRIMRDGDRLLYLLVDTSRWLLNFEDICPVAMSHKSIFSKISKIMNNKDASTLLGPLGGLFGSKFWWRNLSLLHGVRCRAGTILIIERFNRKVIGVPTLIKEVFWGSDKK